MPGYVRSWPGWRVTWRARYQTPDPAQPRVPVERRPVSWRTEIDPDAIPSRRRRFCAVQNMTITKLVTAYIRYYLYRQVA
jgi:hypothetical protein